MKTCHGLTEDQLAIVRRVLASFATRFTTVVVYGSRASGRHRPASDLDLAVHGPISAADIRALQDAFADSDLAIEVDVLAYDLLENEGLRRHIDAYGALLFTDADLRASDEALA